MLLEWTSSVSNVFCWPVSSSLGRTIGVASNPNSPVVSRAHRNGMIGGSYNCVCVPFRREIRKMLCDSLVMSAMGEVIGDGGPSLWRCYPW